MCYKSACYTPWEKPHFKRHFRQHVKRRWKQRMAAWWLPPINVEELDDRYEIYLYAAGYSKEDFQVKLEDNTLILSVDEPPSDRDKGVNWRKREFHAGSFERYFELNEKIDKEAISAKYEEGILKVILPKLAGAETLRQDIDVV